MLVLWRGVGVWYRRLDLVAVRRPFISAGEIVDDAPIVLSAAIPRPLRVDQPEVLERRSSLLEFLTENLI